MATKKLDSYIVDAFKSLDFTDKEIQDGCWLLERKFKNDDGSEEIKPVAWIAYHKFLERVAQKAGITFDEPKIFNLQLDEIALYVNGHKGDFSAWAIGEASNGNLTKTSKNYRWAMAEKRAKDRVILKLLGIAGDMYSEEEADEFKEKRPEKTDFEKEATKAKSQETKAINKAIKEGKDELPQKEKSEEDLKKQFTKTMEHLVNIKSFTMLTPAQIDFINKLAVELFERGFEQEHKMLCDLFNKLKSELIKDEVVF